MIDTEFVIAVLRELLAAEQRSLPPRLAESTVFVSRLSIDDEDALRRMVHTHVSNCERLTKLILSIGGSPGPRAGDVRSATLHFLALHHALPQLLADREMLIRKYTAAAQRLAGSPAALGAVNSILERHREEIGVLQRLLGTSANRRAG